MEKNSHTLTSPTLPGRAWQHLRMMLLTALLAAMTGLTAIAQDTRTLTVYDGTATNTYVPAYIYYFDGFTRSQFVIPESELDSLAGGIISSLTFYTTDDNVPYTTTCSADVYLMEVDYTAMTAFEPKASGTTVYQGTFSIEQTGDGYTMTITFSTPYTYGGGNLLIGIENITEEDDYEKIIFYGQTVNAAAAWAGYDYESLDNVTGSQQNFIPKTTFTYTPGSNPVYCRPTALTLDDVGVTTATLSWTAPSDDVTDYAYQYKPTDTEAWSNEATVTTTTATLSGLTAATTYDFRVKARYDGGESKYATISFNTIAIPVAVGDSWSDDFEGDACSWLLVNGNCANAWAWGTATHSGGTHALYISNDDGTNNAYVTGSNPTMVYAAKPFTFASGKYEIAYDWRCYGEGNGEVNYDYLRVALVPATEALEASTSAPSDFGYSSLPTGWIAVDGGGQLNKTQDWQSKSAAVSSLAAGSYYLVFAWRNDGSSGSQPPAAVDNVSIHRVGCAADVDDLTVSYMGGTTATLSWAAGEATQWQVAYSTSSNFAQATEAIVDLNPNLSVQTYTITNLPLNRTCYARVRAYCGGTDYGAWSATVSFDTTDKYIIGTGTQTSTDLPTHSRYNYSRTQQLYTAAELGTAGAIMSIAFKNTSTVTCTRNIDIYMVGTAKSSFESEDDWVGTTADDLVFSGEVTFAAGRWTTITLDTPYEYNGQSNVVIAVNDNTGIYNDTEFLTFSAKGQALYAYSNDIMADDNSGFIGDSKNQLHLGKGEQPAVVSPTALAVGYTGGTTATLSWTENGTATEWEICLNGDEANLVSVGAAQCTVDNGQWTMELTGLSYATIYQVKVRARQGSGVSYWSLPTRFNTELCPPEDLCNIALALTDSDGDGWEGNAIKVVDKLTGIVIGTYANTEEAGADNPQTFLAPVPNGRDIQFVWVEGDSPNECSFSIYDVNAELIYRFDKNDDGPAAGLIDTYTVDCTYSPWRTPTAFNVVQRIPTTATLSWTERGEATAWVVAYKADGDEEFTEVNVNQNENQNVVTYTLTGLAGLTQYTVKVRPDSGDAGVIKWSDAITFTTIDANPVPTNVTATAGIRKATLSWTGYGDNYNVKYRPAETHFANLLFTEGFEGGIDNWILRDCDRRTAISNTKVHAGNQAFMFDNKNNQYLISPELTDIAEGTLMEFYYSNYYNNEDQNLVTFQVGFSSTTNETGEFDFGPTITTYDAQWHLYSAAVPAGTKYVCWKVLSTRTWMFFIDDIKIGKEVEFTNLSTTATTKTLTGLAPETTYEYQVQSVKDEAASAWTELATFTTQPLISIELADDGTANATTLSTCDGEEDVTVTLSGRTIYADGTWQALCLPFALNTLNGTPLDGFTVKELDTEGKWEKINEQWTTSSNGHQTGIDNDGNVYLHFKDATTIEAGKPYIVRKLVLDEEGTAPTYTATGGTPGSLQQQGYEQLMDGKTDGYRWRTSGVPSYCDFEANKLVYATGYTLTTGNQPVNGDPTVWTLQARNSESDEWTIIDSRNANQNSSDALPSERTTAKEYTIQQPGAYKYFRFEVTQTKGNTFLCLSELTLQGTPVVEGDVVNPVFTGVTINATAPATVSSPDAQVSITGSYDAVAANGKGRSLFFPGSGSRLYNAQAGTTLGACRAFFNIGDGSMQPTLGGSNCLQGIVVPNLLPGDADNDGFVTIDDVIAVVNYILGNTPDNFNVANADVDTNIGITITDAVTIVNMVLTQQEPEPETE